MANNIFKGFVFVDGTNDDFNAEDLDNDNSIIGDDSANTSYISFNSTESDTIDYEIN